MYLSILRTTVIVKLHYPQCTRPLNYRLQQGSLAPQETGVLLQPHGENRPNWTPRNNGTPKFYGCDWSPQSQGSARTVRR